MSPSKFARKTWAALTGLGTTAIVVALAIALSGVSTTAAAYAETVPSPSSEGVSLSLSADASYPQAVETVLTTGTVSPDATDSAAAAALAPFLSTVVSGSQASSARSRALAKAPVVKPKAKKKATVKKKRRVNAKWQRARVSWYGPGFYGNTMAGGGSLTRTSMVVAHRSLPFGTKVEFRYKGRRVTAVVRDRGPYISGRTFDLGPGTARKLKFGGVGTVQYRIIKRR